MNDPKFIAAAKRLTKNPDVELLVNAFLEDRTQIVMNSQLSDVNSIMQSLYQYHSVREWYEFIVEAAKDE